MSIQILHLFKLDCLLVNNKDFLMYFIFLIIFFFAVLLFAAAYEFSLIVTQGLLVAVCGFL